jgi:hypothetical protein
MPANTKWGKVKKWMVGNKYNPAAEISDKPLSEIDDLYATQAGKKSIGDIIDNALGKVGYKTPEEVADWGINEFVANKGGNRTVSAIRALKAHPELLSQFDSPTLRELVNRPSTLVDIGKSWVINKAGDDAAAERLVGKYNINVEDIRKDQDNARAKKAARAGISKVLKAGAGELDERDERFLKDVANDPGIMTTGHPTDPEGFKLWLLERGHGLLSGTSAARPAWEVE